jgi:chitinase
MHPLTPSRTPSVSPIRTATYTPKPSSTPVPTATPEETPTPTHGPGVTPSPTDTPQAIFRLTLKDNPDPVPATHRIHYNLCLFNDGEIALTHVVIVDTWKPRECVYLAPDNPPNITWNVGTLNPHQRFCVEFALDTYSICGGRTATNEAVMTCDQGTALVSESTRIGPTPVPVATQTATATETETLTPTATPEGS